MQLTSQANVTLLDTNSRRSVPSRRRCAEDLHPLGIRGTGGLQLTGAIDTFHGSVANSTLIYDLVCR
jgi:hypothetical protein